MINITFAPDIQKKSLQSPSHCFLFSMESNVGDSARLPRAGLWSFWSEKDLPPPCTPLAQRSLPRTPARLAARHTVKASSDFSSKWASSDFTSQVSLMG